MTHFDISTLNSAQVIKGRSKLPLTPYDYGNELPIIKAEDKVKQAKKGWCIWWAPGLVILNCLP